MEAVGVTTNESETLRGWRGLAIQYLLGKYPWWNGKAARGVTVVSAAEGVAFNVLWFQYPFWTLRRPRAYVCPDMSLISNQPAA